MLLVAKRRDMLAVDLKQTTTNGEIDSNFESSFRLLINDNYKGSINRCYKTESCCLSLDTETDRLDSSHVPPYPAIYNWDNGIISSIRELILILYQKINVIINRHAIINTINK